MAGSGNGTGVFTSSPPSIISPFSSSPSPSSFELSSFVFSTTSEPPTTVIASSDQASSFVIESTEQPSSIAVITSIEIASASGNGAGNASPSQATVLITSTLSASPAPSNTVTHTVTNSPSASKTTSSAAALQTPGSDNSSGSGLSAQGKIAVAVVVPVVAVALIVLAALFLWRKRKQKKDAEELRRKEVEEYGFNPNNDPTLPVVGGTSSNGDDPSQMTEVDGAGYRGWGTTSNPRKPSTTLSSGNGAIGVARSTSGSDTGRFGNGSPTGGTNQSSDGQSYDPLVGSPPNGRPLTGDSDAVGALGAVPSNNNQQNMHRGPSNASSAYSGAHRSDTSGEGTIPSGAAGQQYYNEGMYYDEAVPQHGPYGDGSYGGGQPVIRDVPARRNTRIENPSVIPQQGSAGIAQNF